MLKKNTKTALRDLCVLSSLCGQSFFLFPSPLPLSFLEHELEHVQQLIAT
jgi:hypothetical protein